VIKPKRIEYILEENLLEKVENAYISIRQVYFTYLGCITFWALKYHLVENLKLILKEKPN